MCLPSNFRKGQGIRHWPRVLQNIRTSLQLQGISHREKATFDCQRLAMEHVKFIDECTVMYLSWLVVWNIVYFSTYWE